MNYFCGEKRKIKMKIAVYCSSVDGLPAEWQESARVTGRWIGEHGFSLVYGGVDAGLMRIVAEAAKSAGGQVVGVVPMRRRDEAWPHNDVQVPACDLNDRKGTMQLLGDVFVVLPGGYGTLDEFTTSFSYINFTRQMGKRIIIYNPGGLYDPLLEQLRKMVAVGLMSHERLDVLTVVTSPGAIASALDEAIACVPAESQSRH